MSFTIMTAIVAGAIVAYSAGSFVWHHLAKGKGQSSWSGVP